MKQRPRVPNIAIGPVIARRVFRRSKVSNSRVELQIGAPRRVPGWDWACPVRITGLSTVRPTTRPIFGVDAVQSLLLALQFSRVVLEAQVPRVVWLGKPGDVGLPVTLAPFLPPPARRRVKAAVNREIKRMAKRTSKARRLPKGS